MKNKKARMEMGVTSFFDNERSDTRFSIPDQVTFSLKKTILHLGPTNLLRFFRFAGLTGENI